MKKFIVVATAFIIGALAGGFGHHFGGYAGMAVAVGAVVATQFWALLLFKLTR